jgi:hypothetical protein
MKTCCRCKETLPLSSFGKNKTKKDGYQTACKECKKLYSKERYQRDPQKHIQQCKEWSDRNPEARKKIAKRYYDNNRELCVARSVQWRRDNPEWAKAADKKYGKKWRDANRDVCNASLARYRASKLKATPDWLTQDQLEDIKSMYTLAKKFEGIFGLSYHVDHIVPLQGENVCGLHVPWNLQLLEAKLNLSKSNKTTTQTSL